MLWQRNLVSYDDSSFVSSLLCELVKRYNAGVHERLLLSLLASLCGIQYRSGKDRKQQAQRKKRRISLAEAKAGAITAVTKTDSIIKPAGETSHGNCNFCHYIWCLEH